MGFHRHIGWALDFGAERGHGAVGAIVRSLLTLPREASPADVERMLAAATDPTKSADDDALYLRDLMEVPQRDEDRALYEAIDAGARARSREGALARLVKGASRRHPILVVVEDAHWADVPTLALFAALARATTECRAVLALTTRIDGDPFDAGGGRRRGMVPK